MTELKFVEGSGILVKKVKCNFRTMGKKYGKLMKAIAAQMASLSQEDISKLETQGNLALSIEGQEVMVDVADVEIISEDIPGWLVANDGNLTVALEIEMSDELRREGMARELINRIQNIRKDNGLEITDHIDIVVSSNEQSDTAISSFADYIKAQVLANNIVIAPNDGTVVDMDEFDLNIRIEKVSQ